MRRIAVMGKPFGKVTRLLGMAVNDSGCSRGGHGA
jgi:hypothetical protein